MLIREATLSDVSSITRINIDTWRTTYRGIISDQFLDQLSYNKIQQMWKQLIITNAEKSHILVAESDQGNVVGFVSAGMEREESKAYDGEIYAIYIIKEFQGRGWGKQLFIHSIKQLLIDGFSSMMLWVLKDNPSRGFYKALGGKLIKEKEIEIGGNILTEVAYRWDQLNDCLSVW